MNWWEFDGENLGWAEREMVQSRLLQALNWRVAPLAGDQRRFLLANPKGETVYCGQQHAILRAIQDAALVPQYTLNLSLVSETLDLWLFERHPFGYYTLTETRESHAYSLQLVTPDNAWRGGKLIVDLPTANHTVVAIQAYGRAIVFLRLMQREWRRANRVKV